MKTDLDEACKIWRDTESGFTEGICAGNGSACWIESLVGRKIKEKPGDEKERLYAAPQLYDRLVYRLHPPITIIGGRGMQQYTPRERQPTLLWRQRL